MSAVVAVVRERRYKASQRIWASETGLDLRVSLPKGIYTYPFC